MEFWEAQKDFIIGKETVTVKVKGKTKKAVSQFLKKYKLDDKK